MRSKQKPAAQKPVFVPPTAMRSADDPPSKACLPVRRPSVVSSLPSIAIPTLSLSSLARTPRSSPRTTPRNSPCTSRTPSPPLNSNYTELLVLIHGLQGNVEDFNFFASQLDTSPPALAGALLVHASAVNTERTHDGVPEGASRLADDIRRVAALHPSLTHISLIGFSLGGLYARYVAALLYADGSNRLGNEASERGKLAGLVPQTFATVAAPNLGVRSFGIYRFLPSQVFGMTKFLLGKTGDELVLNDGGGDAVPLLVRMSKDSESGGLLFVSALQAFQKRICYGNMQQDFMVNFGTAVLDHSVNGLGGPDVQNLIRARAAAANAQTVDPAHDGRGCKVAFTYTYPAREDVEAGTEDTPEAGMAKRLQALGWDVVAIDFPNLLPITHNMIMANSKNKLFAWMNAPGQRAVLHLVDNLVSHHDSHEPLFQATSSSSVATTHAGFGDGANDSVPASMIS